MLPRRSGGRVFMPSRSRSRKAIGSSVFDRTSQASTLPFRRTPITSGMSRLGPTRPVAVRQLRWMVTYSYSPDAARRLTRLFIASAWPGVVEAACSACPYTVSVLPLAVTVREVIPGRGTTDRPLFGASDCYRHRKPRSSFLAGWPHMSLDQNAPEPRAVEGPERGRVVAEPMVGGLHNRYRHAA
jgi:hypothetical protein